MINVDQLEQDAQAIPGDAELLSIAELVSEYRDGSAVHRTGKSVGERVL